MSARSSPTKSSRPSGSDLYRAALGGHHVEHLRHRKAESHGMMAGRAIRHRAPAEVPAACQNGHGEAISPSATRHWRVARSTESMPSPVTTPNLNTVSLTKAVGMEAHQGGLPQRAEPEHVKEIDEAINY